MLILKKEKLQYRLPFMNHCRLPKMMNKIFLFFKRMHEETQVKIISLNCNFMFLRIL